MGVLPCPRSYGSTSANGHINTDKAVFAVFLLQALST